ncbi:MAG: hypothetical protein JF606_05150 [Burkholderiales bacterium]|jgi:mono/diheme cytochrome c family protein|nr:hypothetical protein [Burkholderiales bacterium]
MSKMKAAVFVEPGRIVLEDSRSRTLARSMRWCASRLARMVRTKSAGRGVVRPTGARTIRLAGCLAATSLWLGACAVEVSNMHAARDVASAAPPSGSIYTGWRVFQDRCAHCHGPAATGSEAAPDLVLTVRTMGPRRFVDAVLGRYDWNLTSVDDGDAGARDRRIDEVLKRRVGELSMPDWQGEPRVTAHIADLYEYLSARAEGTQGPGRPAR